MVFKEEGLRSCSFVAVGGYQDTDRGIKPQQQSQQMTRLEISLFHLLCGTGKARKAAAVDDIYFISFCPRDE